MNEAKEKALRDLVERLEKLSLDFMDRLMKECLNSDKVELTAEDAITATRFIVKKLYTTFEKSWEDFRDIKAGINQKNNSPYNQT